IALNMYAIGVAQVTESGGGIWRVKTYPFHHSKTPTLMFMEIDIYGDSVAFISGKANHDVFVYTQTSGFKSITADPNDRCWYVMTCVAKTFGMKTDLIKREVSYDSLL